MKKKKYAIILLVITLFLVELVSHVGLSLLEKRGLMPKTRVETLSSRQAKIVEQLLADTSSYYVHCPELGWSIKKNGAKDGYSANSAGIRSSREYNLKPPQGVQRVSAFGDSFTHCDKVSNPNTWQAIIESSNSDLEMLNFGVGGYGLDQAYLRYLKDGRDYKSHVVLIGFMTENIFRHVNTFRPFYMPKTRMPLSKPRFHIDSDELTLIPNLLDDKDDYKKLISDPQEVMPKLGSQDHYYQRHHMSGILDRISTLRLIRILANKISYRMSGDKIVVNDRYNNKSEAFEVTTKIMDEFYGQVITDNAKPIIVIFPTKEELVRHQRKQERQYTPLIAYLKSKGHAYIDLMDAFEKDDEIMNTFNGHYSNGANRLIAEHIHEHLNSLNSIL